MAEYVIGFAVSWLALGFFTGYSFGSVAKAGSGEWPEAKDRIAQEHGERRDN